MRTLSLGREGQGGNQGGVVRTKREKGGNRGGVDLAGEGQRKCFAGHVASNERPRSFKRNDKLAWGVNDSHQLWLARDGEKGRKSRRPSVRVKGKGRARKLFERENQGGGSDKRRKYGPLCGKVTNDKSGGRRNGGRKIRKEKRPATPVGPGAT